MKSLVALSLALVLAGCSKPSRTMQVDPNGPAEVAIPDHGAYTGAFMDFGDAEDDVTLETIEDFEAMVGKHQAIIVSSSYWGEQNFPTIASKSSIVSSVTSSSASSPKSMKRKSRVSAVIRNRDLGRPVLDRLASYVTVAARPPGRAQDSMRQAISLCYCDPALGTLIISNRSSLAHLDQRCWASLNDSRLRRGVRPHTDSP